MPTVATVTDVLNIAGATVTSDQLSLAHSDIEIFSGRLFLDLESGALNTGDLGWLKRAVCYQARHRKNSPEIFDSLDVERVSDGGGQDTTFVGGGPILHPLARHALRNVTWRGTRSVPLAVPESSASAMTSLSRITDGGWRRM